MQQAQDAVTSEVWLSNECSKELVEEVSIFTYFPLLALHD